MKNNTSKIVKVKPKCEWCDNKPLSVKYECRECGALYCKKCGDKYNRECINCTPPELVEITYKLTN